MLQSNKVNSGHSVNEFISQLLITVLKKKKKMQGITCEMMQISNFKTGYFVLQPGSVQICHKDFFTVMKQRRKTAWEKILNTFCEGILKVY